MKVLLRGPTRAEVDKITYELRLQRWRRRPVAVLVTAALAAGSVVPATAGAVADGGGGWDGSVGSSSPSSQETSSGGWDGTVGSSSPSSQESSTSTSSSSGGGSSIGSSSPSSQESSSSSSGSSSSTSSSSDSSDSDSGSISSPTEAADAAPGPSSSSSDDSDDDGGWDGTVGPSSPSSQETNSGGGESLASSSESSDSDESSSADASAPTTTAMGDVDGPSTPSTDTSDDSSSDTTTSPAAEADDDSGWDGTVGSSSPSSRESQAPATDAPATDTSDDLSSDTAAPSAGSTTTTSPAAEADDDGWDGSIGPSSPSSQEDTAPTAKSESAAPTTDASAPAVTAMGDVAAPAPAVDTTTTTTAPAKDNDAAPPSHAGPVGEPAESTPTDDEWDGTVGPSSPSSQEPSQAPDTTAPSNAPAQNTNNNTRPGASEDEDDEPAYGGTPGPEAELAPELTEQGDVETKVDEPDTSMQELGLPANTSGPQSYQPQLPAEYEGLPVPGYAQPEQPAQPSTDGFGGNVTVAVGLGATAGFARDADHTAVTLGIAEGFGVFGSVGQEDAPETPISAQSAVTVGIGPLSGELEVGTSSGITGTLEVPMEVNPALSQTTNHSINVNNGFEVQTESTEGMAFGEQGGATLTHSVTVSIPNDTIDTVGSWFGLTDAPDDRNGYVTGGGF